MFICRKQIICIQRQLFAVICKLFVFVRKFVSVEEEFDERRKRVDSLTTAKAWNAACFDGCVY